MKVNAKARQALAIHIIGANGVMILEGKPSQSNWRIYALDSKRSQAMRIEDRILFLENGMPCIFFPVGKPSEGGSCDFITDRCLRHCPSSGVVHEHEKRALRYFKKTTVADIIKRIMIELNFFRSNYLGWFSWGDCPLELTDKISSIVLGLAQKGIVQNGFTLNEKFWKRIPFTNDLRIALTVYSFNEVEIKSKNKMVCFPDIPKGQARVFYKGKCKARCSGYFCVHEGGRTVEADCEQCYIDRVGCFCGKEIKVEVEGE